MCDKNKLACGYGTHEYEQRESLRKMKALLKSWHIIGNTYKIPFEKGILLSIDSTLDLFEELKKEGVKFLLTSRLNQDILENFFSRLRGIGGSNSHPSPVEVGQRIKILMLGKNSEILVKNPSVEVEEEEDFLTAIITRPISDVVSKVGNEEGNASKQEKIMASVNLTKSA
jgi:hypothetical protein